MAVKHISMGKYILIIVAATITCFISCRESKQRTNAEEIVKEWTGKTIQFPNVLTCKSLGKDAVCTELFGRPYKVLVYIDSSGCMGCKLRMQEWKKIIKEMDSIAPENVSFLFFFNPKDERELDILMKQEQFDYPIFVDKANLIDELNNFPKDMKFQSFLLNEQNEVLAIGSPSMNFQVWELYKQLISGEKFKIQTLLTTVVPEQAIIELLDLRMESKTQATFVLKNIGEEPLIIQDIKSSCDCMVSSWDKSPIKSGDKTQIVVEIKSKELGHIHKTIDVYCNVEGHKLQLSIKGVVKLN